MFNKDIKVPLQEAELVGTSSSNSGGRPLRIYGRRSRVIWGDKCHPFKKMVGCRIHCEAQPTVDGALQEKELGECIDDKFAEGANVGKIQARLQGVFF